VTTPQIVFLCIWFALSLFCLVWSKSTRRALVRPAHSAADLLIWVAVYLVSTKLFGSWTQASGLEIAAELAVIVGLVVVGCVGAVKTVAWWRVVPTETSER
jgi:hypothetical protein